LEEKLKLISILCVKVWPFDCLLDQSAEKQMQGMCGLVQRNLYECEIWGSLGGDY
jgi:hypothetical protein